MKKFIFVCAAVVALMCSCGGGSGNDSSDSNKEDEAIDKTYGWFFDDFPSGIGHAEFTELIKHQGVHAGSTGMEVISDWYDTYDNANDLDFWREEVKTKNVYMNGKLASLALLNDYDRRIRVTKVDYGFGEGYEYNMADFVKLLYYLQKDMEKQWQKSGYEVMHSVSEDHLKRILTGRWRDGEMSYLAYFRKGNIIAFIYLLSLERNYIDTEHVYKIRAEVRDIDIDKRPAEYIIERSGYHTGEGGDIDDLLDF